MKSTKQMLINRRFRFGRTDGSVIAEITLNPDGSIGGYNHFNERNWAVQNGKLMFKSADGKTTTIFDEGQRRNNQLSYIGRFLLLGGERIHTLIEIKPKTDPVRG